MSRLLYYKEESDRRDHDKPTGSLGEIESPEVKLEVRQ